jgi:protein TonB
VVAAVVVLSLRMHPVQVFSLPGTDLGTRVELSYLPGRAPVPAPHPQVRVKPKAVSGPEITPSPAAPAAPDAIHLPPLPHLTVTEAAPSPNVASPASATPDSISGSDSYGSGSIQIALTTYSPSPAPDLSALPHGVQGDVVVDVTIDPNGKVADLAVLHTLGYGIETSVIGTLKTWTFRPATKDGAPIASVQELHFHFGPV